MFWPRIPDCGRPKTINHQVVWGGNPIIRKFGRFMAARENPTWIDSRQSPVWLKTSWKTPWNSWNLMTWFRDTAGWYCCWSRWYTYVYILYNIIHMYDDFKSVPAMPAMFDSILTDDPNWLKIRAIVPSCHRAMAALLKCIGPLGRPGGSCLPCWPQFQMMKGSNGNASKRWTQVPSVCFPIWTSPSL